MTEPPQYTASSSSHPPPNLFSESESAPTILFNVTPLPNAVSFQSGFLGYTNSAVKGEVQIKVIDGDVKENSSRPRQGRFRKVEIQFRGVERGNGEEVEFTEQSKVLWENSLEAAKAALAVGPSTIALEDVQTTEGPESTLPFEFELTSDLPHCVHQSHDPITSNLEYSLIARLHFIDQSIPPIERELPIHLTRYTPPGPLPSAFSSTSTADYNPQTVSVQEPIPVIVNISKTRLRNSDSLIVLTKIPPPVGDVVIIKELRLRNISAEIVRVVRTLNAPSDSDDEDASEPDPAAQESETVLWRSGKSCRLSPSRAIVIRLHLHLSSSFQSSDTVCETISQGTILHEVEFYIRVTVAMTSGLGDRSERQNIVVEKRLEILPDSPPPGISSEKQRLLEQDNQVTLDPPAWEDSISSRDNANTAPAYRESWLEEDSNTFVGTSRSQGGNGWIEVATEEEEFDGYEELSTGADLRLPPPTIDEDESPPPAPGMQTAYNTGHGSASSHDTPGHQTELSEPFPQRLHHRHSFGSTSTESFMLIPISPSTLSLALQSGAPTTSMESHGLEHHDPPIHNPPPQVFTDPEIDRFSDMDLTDHRFIPHRHSPYPRELSPPNPTSHHFMTPDGMTSSYSSSGSEQESHDAVGDRDARPPPYAGTQLTQQAHVPVNLSNPESAQPGPPPSYHDSNPESSIRTEVLGLIGSDGRVGVVML